MNLHLTSIWLKKKVEKNLISFTFFLQIKKKRRKKIFTAVTGKWNGICDCGMDDEADDDAADNNDWWLVLCTLFCNIKPGCGAGRLCCLAGAVGGISCDVACKNHGSLPLFTADDCEKPRWWPTITVWPDACKFKAWLFITPTEPVEFLRPKNFFNFRRSILKFLLKSTSIKRKNKKK